MERGAKRIINHFENQEHGASRPLILGEAKPTPKIRGKMSDTGLEPATVRFRDQRATARAIKDDG